MAESLAKSDRTAEQCVAYILKNLTDEKIEAKHSELINLKNNIAYLKEDALFKMEKYKQVAAERCFMFFIAGLACPLFLPWLWKVVH